MITQISERQPKARKQHVCEECGQLIHKGTTYAAQTCTDGGDIWTFKAHEDCMLVGIHYRTKHRLWNDEWLPLYELMEDKPLIEWIAEQADEIRAESEIRRMRDDHSDTEGNPERNEAHAG